MEELSNGDVFLRVNGVAYTKKDFLIASSLHDKIRRLYAGDPLTGPNPQAEAATLKSRPRTASEILRRALIRQYAKHVGVSPTKEEFDEYVSGLLKSMKQRKATLRDVAAKFGEAEGKLFLQYVADDAVAQPLRNHFDTEGILKITDADVLAVSNRILRTQQMAVASNAIERAALEKALAAVKAGEDFSKVADKYSATPPDGKVWGEYLLEELEEVPALVKWLKDAKSGDVSEILELDDGFAVVKVLQRHPEELPPGSTDVPRDVWKVARISRKCYDGLPDKTRKEIVEDLYRRRNNKIQRQIGDAVMAEAVIEWPHGTNLFENVAIDKQGVKK